MKNSKIKPLQRDLQQFQDSVEKIYGKSLPKISVVGCFQNGKSTFINCLLDEFVARPGDGRATTKISTRYRWGESTRVNLRTDGGLESISLEEYLKSANFEGISQNSAFQAEITLSKSILQKIELIDTPGFNANEQDTENVTRSLEEANYAIVLLTNERTLGESELAMFDCIKSKQIPFAIIMNCRDVNTPTEWYPNHGKNLKIIKANEVILKKWGYSPEKIDDNLIYPCNLLWYLFAINTNILASDYDYDVEDLWKKIEFALERKEEILSRKNLLRLSNFSRIQSFFQDRLAHIIAVDS